MVTTLYTSANIKLWEPHQDRIHVHTPDRFVRFGTLPDRRIFFRPDGLLVIEMIMLSVTTRGTARSNALANGGGGVCHPRRP